MKKHTKILATIGPATETEEILRDLIVAGMNIARFNTKHADPTWHNERIQRVRKVAKEIDTPTGILLDLQGPEIRIEVPGGKAFPVKKGEIVTFTSDTKKTGERVAIIPQMVVDSINEGNEILLDDGSCEFTIVTKSGDHLDAQAMFDCTVGHRKTMNTPGIILDMPSLTERDYAYLDGVDGKNVDFVGLSFVRNKQDIAILRQALAERGYTAQIVGKLENQAALDNLDEIIEASDAIMVARGDLGVEVPYEQLIYWQKEIIRRCRIAAKPVITATQMLKSMVESPRPTRAEISDVAHAIYDSTDAIMLSEETTIGKYPVKAVGTQTKIATFNEEFVDHHDIETLLDDNTSAIAEAAKNIVEESQVLVDKVVCLTETGRTARNIARYRLHVPTVAITSTLETLHQLTLLYGVTPYLIDLPNEKLMLEEKLLDQFLAIGAVKPGEKILLVHGSFWKKPGLTNSISIVDVPVD
jgi:pyruvate kinase